MSRRGWLWFAVYAAVSVVAATVAVRFRVDRVTVATVELVLLAVGVVASVARWLWVTR